MYEGKNIMKTKITVIVDNISSDGIKGEWGLSVIVEYAGKRVCEVFL